MGRKDPRPRSGHLTRDCVIGGGKASKGDREEIAVEGGERPGKGGVADIRRPEHEQGGLDDKLPRG